MDTVSSRKHSRTVSVTCTHCGDSDQINDRSLRRKQAEGRPHLCRMCRSVQAIELTQSDRNYWLSRFSQQELERMVGSII